MLARQGFKLYSVDWDAEGTHQGDLCEACGSTDTVTYYYQEGFTEVECRRCGHSTEAEEIAALTRYQGKLLEAQGLEGTLPPIKRLKA